VRADLDFDQCVWSSTNHKGKARSVEGRSDWEGFYTVFTGLNKPSSTHFDTTIGDGPDSFAI